MSILDLGKVKEWLQVIGEDDDAQISNLMDRAEDFVQRELDWWFDQPRQTQEVLDGNGLMVLWLRQPPVGDVITVETRDYAGADWTTVDAADYELNERELAHVYYWFPGKRNYRATYNEGFTTPPGDIVQLLLDLIARKWEKANRTGVQSERLGRYSYSLGDLTSTPGWEEVVSHWQRGRI